MMIRGIMSGVLVASLAGFVGCNRSESGGLSFSQQYTKILRQSNAEVRAKSLCKLALKQKKSGDIGGAGKSVASASEACKSISNPVARASAYNSLAFTQGTLGRTSDAKASLRAVNKVIDSIGEDQPKVAELSRMARTFAVFLDNTTAADAHMEKAEKLIRNMDDPKIKVSALKAAADNYFKMEKIDDANRLADEALEYSRSIENLRTRSDSISDVAALFHRLERDQESGELFFEAHQTADQIEGLESRAYALADIAQKERQSSRSSSAHKTLHEAQEIADRITDRSAREPLLDKIYSQLEKL